MKIGIIVGSTRPGRKAAAVAKDNGASSSKTSRQRRISKDMPSSSARAILGLSCARQPNYPLTRSRTSQSQDDGIAQGKRVWLQMTGCYFGFRSYVAHPVLRENGGLFS